MHLSHAMNSDLKSRNHRAKFEISCTISKSDRPLILITLSIAKIKPILISTNNSVTQNAKDVQFDHIEYYIYHYQPMLKAAFAYAISGCIDVKKLMPIK